MRPVGITPRCERQAGNPILSRIMKSAMNRAPLKSPLHFLPASSDHLPMADLDLSLRKRCLDYFAAAIGWAPAVADPFPHVVVNGFFPEDVYRDLLRKLPDTALYEPFSYGKHHTAAGESNRMRFRLTSDCLERLDARRRSFWLTIRSVLGSRELKMLTFEKVAAGLAYRYSVSQDQVSSLPGYALPELFHERGGYAIDPHPDTRRKVVTMQIALPRDDSQRDLGTEFYARSLRPSALLRPPRGFSIVRRMEFLPNTAYAFAVLNTLRLKSWHGRTAIPASLGDRNSILNIWYAKVEDANAELVEETRRLEQPIRARAA
jgi:hypothetical protein